MQINLSKKSGSVGWVLNELLYQGLVRGRASVVALSKPSQRDAETPLEDLANDCTCVP